MYDFVLTNGTVIDPAAGLNAQRNVVLQGGRVAAILDPAAPFVAQSARGGLDCMRLLVVPGLIDFHVHVFPGVSNFGVDPDETCLARGVTTVLDFGTAGGLIFDGFRRFVIDAATTRVKALMLIAGQGLISSNDTKPALGELWDIAYCDVAGCVQAVEKHRDCVLGIADEIGTLKPGACADITVLDIVDGEFPLTDSEGQTEIGRRRFEVRHCFRAGRRVGLLPCRRAAAH